MSKAAIATTSAATVGLAAADGRTAALVTAMALGALCWVLADDGRSRRLVTLVRALYVPTQKKPYGERARAGSERSAKGERTTVGGPTAKVGRRMTGSFVE
jgi:hypothetical protein